MRNLKKLTRDTTYESELRNAVMADLRSHGAKCCLLTYSQSGDVAIRASFPDGRLWEVVAIEDDYIYKKYH